ncbi:DHA1 family inner membrane transport protein [Inquilinus ginsengisoli]|uniref:DHA1 family inner membrane transport protein n=1 Tax=Inquilinus ginsengisoli TaxID=363840 RepID=A0ABU1JME5_9PROT|nr:MFS transporter [Inquilinus ginsengisoli]MDR6289783.1 DHA1 family inner membrane transport protein [Inquilinus ginsengisoli]
MPLPLFALAVAAFGIGTTEFVIMGLLPDVARDLGVSIPAAGMLVSGYALSVTIGAPIVAILTAKLPRKLTLIGLMGVFILGNLLCALAPSYWTLMAARVLTALCHGAFFGIGAVVAANLVPRHQRSRAIALMFSGLTLANVLGVPFGTWLGHAAGWRATFAAIVPIGIAAAVAIAAVLPRDREAPPASLLSEFSVLRKPQVLLAMALSILSSVSLFSIFTYITPILETVSGLTPQGVTTALLLFGVGITVGNLFGGRLADWKLMPAVMASLAALAVICTVFGLAAPMMVPAVAAMVLWGVVQFSLGAPLQTRVVDQAHEAPNLASTLNQGAFNLGNAGGASLGGAAIAAGMPYGQLPYIGAAVAVVGLGVAVLSYAMERRSRAPVLA